MARYSTRLPGCYCRILPASALLLILVMAGATFATMGNGVASGFSSFAFTGLFVLCCLIAADPLGSALSRSHSVVVWFVTPILYSSLGVAFYLFGEWIDQPHPVYLEGNWFTLGMREAVRYAVVFGVGSSLLVCLDSFCQRNRPKDQVYFASYRTLTSGLMALRVRLALMVGLLVVLGYFSLTIVELTSQEALRAGIVWPPKRVFVSCVLLWGILWVVDCWSRPHKGTLVAALGFLLLSCLLFPIAFGVLRE